MITLYKQKGINYTFVQLITQIISNWSTTFLHFVYVIDLVTMQNLLMQLFEGSQFIPFTGLQLIQLTLRLKYADLKLIQSYQPVSKWLGYLLPLQFKLLNSLTV